MPFAHRVSVIAVIAMFGAAGCTRHVYEIEMTPRGPEIERTMRAAEAESVDGSGLAEREVQRLEAAYGQAAVHEKDHVRLTRTFTKQLPQDVGGAGSYAFWETSLGSASLYLERFRGETELMTLMQQRLDAADMAVDLLYAFVEAEAADSPAGDRLRDFVDDELRSDAKNATLLFWTMQIAMEEMGRHQLHEGAIARGIQFLVERNYITLTDLAEAIHIDPSRSDRRYELLLEMLARKLVTPKEELLNALPPLRSLVGLSQAFNVAVSESDIYRVWLAQRPEDEEQPDEQRAGVAALKELVFRSIGSPLSEHDELSVRLVPPEKPFATNGVSQNDGGLEWSTLIAIPGQPARHGVPTLCYAVWSQPDEAFQTAHFGEVLLKDRPLGEYVVWRRGLNDVEGTEWDDFLTTLAPDDNPLEQLAAFRFSTAPGDGDGADIRVQNIIDLLSEATTE